MLTRDYDIKKEFSKDFKQHQRMLFNQISLLLSSEDHCKSLYDYYLEAGFDEKALEKFKIETADDISYDVLGSSTYVLRFLQFLIKANGCKKVLELGTFIGVSSLFLAEALPEDGHLITVEAVEKFAKISCKNFANNAAGAKIELVEGDLRKLYPTLLEKGPYDLIFIDANKESYFESAERLYPKLNKGGMIIVDDALFHGDVINKTPTTTKGLGVKKCIDFLLSKEDLFSVMLPLCNGVMLSIKQ